MRALERKQERVEKDQEERRLNDLQKKKAKEAIKLID
jgi:hypothetical protein